MAALITHAVHMTFRDVARAALTTNGLDADTILKEFVTSLNSQTDAMQLANILTVEHEGTTFEFKKIGCSVNFILMGRLKGEEQWLEVAFLSDH